MRKSALLLFVFLSGAAHAQTPASSLEVLSLPRVGTIVCTMPDSALMNGLPPKAIGREFRIGEQIPGPISMWPRDINILFDTTGTAVVISDETMQYTPSGLFSGSTTAVVRFGANNRTYGQIMSMVVDTMVVKEAVKLQDVQAALAASRAAAGMPTHRMLTDGEMEKARALGTWLWEHRCFK